MRGFESQFRDSLINAPRLPLQRQRLPNPYHRYIRAMLPARRQTRPHKKRHHQPGLGAAQGQADVLDGPAGEAATDGALTRREFVVDGVLRGAATGGCPWGRF